jgi:hypothetical protein
MVPGPEFEDAARIFAGMSHVDFGLHVCLSAEWDEPRWGPVAPREQVPSLLDEDGFFTRMPKVLHERGFSVAEAMLEIEAQLHKARDAGIKISYIDEHIGVSWVHPDVRAGIVDLARREGLIDAYGVTGLDGVNTSAVDGAQQLKASLSRATAGTYLLLAHPMFDDEEARTFHGMGCSGDQIAQGRDNDRKMFIDQDLMEWVQQNSVELRRYSEALG